MNLHTEYWPIEGEKNKFIKTTIHYNKETYHWATGKSKQKGYAVNCTPVEKGDMFESFTAFTGFYDIIYPIDRQSKKRLQTAIKMLEESTEKYKQYFRDQEIKVI